MNKDAIRLSGLSKEVNGQLRTSRNGLPYLVVDTSKFSERLRVFYFEKTHEYKIYLDIGISCSKPVGRCTTPDEAKGIIDIYR
jgi:hypothetical protein